MTKESYIKITGIVRDNPTRIRTIQIMNKICTDSYYLLYPLFILLLFIKKEPFLLRSILVPAISFIAVSIFRKVMNAPRPYEKFNMPPVLKKETNGNSFPSRHVFSAFIIAMTIFYQYTGVGILLFVMGVGLAIFRVVGGVHEPRDVIAGALVGIASGLLGYYII